MEVQPEKKIDKEPKNPYEITEDILLIEKIWLVMKTLQSKIDRVLEGDSKFGNRARIRLAKIVNEITWQIHHRTGLLDKTKNKGFIDDLKNIKVEFDIPQNAQTIYIGSNNDTSARRVFQATLHVDVKKPQKTPTDFKFRQAGAADLPAEDKSIDLIILKHFPFSELNQSVIDEFERKLHPNGKIVFYSLDPNRPDHPCLVALNNWGIRVIKFYPNGTVVLAF